MAWQFHPVNAVVDTTPAPRSMLTPAPRFDAPIKPVLAAQFALVRPGATRRGQVP
jgi:hypothetical protein